MNMTNKHIGSNFDTFLKEEGILDEAKAHAIKRVLEWQIDNPRNYPDTIPSAESGRLMVRGNKLVTINVDGREFIYSQPGWWCSLDDPDDMEGQLVDEDNIIADISRKSAKAI